MKEKVWWLWYSSIPSINNATKKALLNAFHYNPKEVYDATDERILKIEELTKIQKENIIKTRRNFNFEQLYDVIKNTSANIITYGEEEYPQLLKEIYDPPMIYYQLGNYKRWEEKRIAIVGSRECSSSGKKAAFDIAKELAQYGYTIVSGLARGIDKYAHEGALSGGGKTIAVTGCGWDIIYPKENNMLYKRILQNGSVITEYEEGIPPLPYHFPMRNRIISGLCHGIVIIEASSKSGSLITAELALQQGREVMAVPGDIFNGRSKGCNMLIQQGAPLVTNGKDVVESLGFSNEFVTKKEKNTQNSKITLEGNPKKIYDCILDEPTPLEKVLIQTKLTTAEVQSTLMLLELKGFIVQNYKNIYVRI